MSTFCIAIIDDDSSYGDGSHFRALCSSSFAYTKFRIRNQGTPLPITRCTIPGAVCFPAAALATGDAADGRSSGRMVEKSGMPDFVNPLQAFGLFAVPGNRPVRHCKGIVIRP